jgi:hypothetical protein
MSEAVGMICNIVVAMASVLFLWRVYDLLDGKIAKDDQNAPQRQSKAKKPIILKGYDEEERAVQEFFGDDLEV